MYTFYVCLIQDFPKVRVSRHDVDAGIGIIRYIHTLVGLSGHTITSEDVRTEFNDVFSRDNKLTIAGSDLIKLRHDVYLLMTNLYHKYLSIQPIKRYSLRNKNNCSVISDDLSMRSMESDDDSSWDPAKEECASSSSDDSMEDDMLHDGVSQDDIGFASDDVAVLQATNGLLCPGDMVAYHQRDNRGSTKTSTIVALHDPSTPDKKEITLANRDILRPYIHEVRRVKMYGGGACGHLTDPLSVWMKLEDCTLFVGCTSTLSGNEDNDTNSDNKNDSCDSEGMCQCEKYSDFEYFSNTVKSILNHINIKKKTRNRLMMTTTPREIQKMVSLNLEIYS
jgi:hypothetical protein